MPSIICVVGVTGNQGGSVAQRFLQEPNTIVRGVTRHPTGPKAKALAAQGIEIVYGDLNDVFSLEDAFQGANLIFSVTNYWEPFFRPDCRARAAEHGISIRKYAADVEYRQGKNIADAAATTVDSLHDNGFLASTLSHVGKCTGGALQECYPFDAKADIFPDYVNRRHPELAAKMSCIQPGLFTSTHMMVPDGFFYKLGDGNFEMRLSVDPQKPIPQLQSSKDMGNFVFAVSQMPPGKSYLAEGTTLTWTEYAQTWSRVTGINLPYKRQTSQQLIDASPDREFGIVLASMFSYLSEPGYDGGATDLLKAEDLKKAGISCPMTTVEEWMKAEDWSPILSK